MTDAVQAERNACAAFAAFLPRARRVAAHSLAGDRQRLEMLADMAFPAVIDPMRGTATVIQELPAEEQVNPLPLECAR